MNNDSLSSSTKKHYPSSSTTTNADIISRSCHHNCCCNWKSCALYESQLQTLKPEFYYYKQKFCIRIASSSRNPKLISFKKCIRHHLSINDNLFMQKKNLYIARHHWHPDILAFISKEKKVLSTPLSSVEASILNLDQPINQMNEKIKKGNVKYHMAPSFPESSVCNLIETYKLKRQQNTAHQTSISTAPLQFCLQTFHHGSNYLHTRVTIRENNIQFIKLQMYNLYISLDCNAAVFSSHSEVLHLSVLLRDVYKSYEPFPLQNCYFHLCQAYSKYSKLERTTRCSIFFLAKVRLSLRHILSCAECVKEKLCQEKRILDSSSSNNNSHWVSASSTVPLLHLSRNQLLNRCKNMKSEMTIMSNRIKNLERKLNKVLQDKKANGEDEIIVSVTNPHYEFIKSVICGERGKETNCNSFSSRIISILLQQDIQNKNVDIDRIKEFAEHLSTHLANFAERMMNPESKKVRFSQTILRIALCLYCQSPSAYRTLKELSLEILPSESLLKKYKSCCHQKDGFNLKTYANFLDDLSPKYKYSANQKTLKGHLMVDEMKLKEDLFWNTHSHELVGFGSMKFKTMDLRDALESLFQQVVLNADNESLNANADTKNGEESKEETAVESHKIATYVNQWRFRSDHNETRNLEFFFGDNKMDGDEILHQFFHVLTGLEMINVGVYGYTSDAGGSNSRALSLFRDAKHLGDTAWPDDTFVTIKNPATEDHNTMALWPCSTHNQKSIRNALLNSGSRKKKHTRCFQIDDSTTFGWETIERLFEYDQQSTLLNTKLDMQSVFPDRWSKMNVSSSKRPFMYDSICFLMVYISRRMSCVHRIVNDGGLNGISREHGHTPNVETMRARLTVLKEEFVSYKLSEEEAINDMEGNAMCLQTFDTEAAAKQFEIITTRKNNLHNIGSDIACLEYSIHVSIIFIENFMNKNERITRENIHAKENLMRESLDYFSSWK